jgi:hypothetical protein
MKEVKRYFMRATRIIECIGDAKCDCDTPCQCVVYATDFDAVLKELEGKLEVAREALNCLYPALVIDLRYNAEDDESREAFASRVKTVEEALALLDKEG